MKFRVEEPTASERLLMMQGSLLEIALEALRMVADYAPYRPPCTSRGKYRRGDGPTTIAKTALGIIEVRGHHEVPR